MKSYSLKEIVSLYTQSASDPKSLTIAYADYFARCEQRLKNNVAQMNNIVLDNVNASLNAQASRETVSLDEDTKQQIFSIGNTMINFEEFTNKVSDYVVAYSNDDSKTEQSLDEGTITFTDISGVEVTYTYEEIQNAITDAQETVYLNALCFSESALEAASALQMNVPESVNYILNQIPNKSSEAVDQVVQLMKSINSDNMSWKERLTTLLDFTGISNLLNAGEEDGEELLNTSIPLGEYTGYNPMANYLSSIDLSSPVKAVVSVGTAVVSGAAKVVKSVCSTVFKWGKKLFGKAKKYLKETFVDPVDYECISGNELECFDAAMTMSGESLNFSQPMADVYWGNFMGVSINIEAFKAAIKESDIYYSVYGYVIRAHYYAPEDKFFFYRYVKPIDYNSVFTALSNQNLLYQDAPFITNYSGGGKQIDFRECDLLLGDCLNILNVIQDAPLLNKSASEQTVLNGVYFSHCISSLFILMQNLLTTAPLVYGGTSSMDTAWNEIKYTLDTPISDVILDLITYDKGRCTYGEMLLTIPVVMSLITQNFQKVDTSATGNISVAPEIVNLTGLWDVFVGNYMDYRVTTMSFTVPKLSTVTNTDFLKAVSLMPHIITGDNGTQRSQFGGGNIKSIVVSPTSGWNVFSENYNGIYGFAYTQREFNDTGSYPQYVKDQAITILQVFSGFLVNMYNMQNVVTDYDAVYVGYSRYSSFLNCNVRIKTDADNKAAVNKFFTILIVTAVAVTVAALSIKAVIAFKKYQRQISATLAAVSTQYGNALANGDFELANSLDMRVKKLTKINSRINKKSKLMSSSIGDIVAQEVSSIRGSDAAEILNQVSSGNDTLATDINENINTSNNNLLEGVNNSLSLTDAKIDALQDNMVSKEDTNSIDSKLEVLGIKVDGITLSNETVTQLAEQIVSLLKGNESSV